jgi:hypothetical protein
MKLVKSRPNAVRLGSRISRLVLFGQFLPSCHRKIDARIPGALPNRHFERKESGLPAEVAWSSPEIRQGPIRDCGRKAHSERTHPGGGPYLRVRAAWVGIESLPWRMKRNVAESRSSEAHLGRGCSLEDSSI